MCVEDDYYQTFNRENVSLIDLSSSPIEEIVSLGVKTTTKLHRLDILVLATGFDAMTGALTAVDIRGRGGVALRDKWKNGARTFLGMTIAEFPNLFTVTGPGSPSVLCNMVSRNRTVCRMDWRLHQVCRRKRIWRDRGKTVC